MRSTRTSPSQALSSHSSAGRSGRIPAASRASSARSTSSALIIRSRSWRVSGPPRAQLARLPPSRNGTSASRRAAADFFSVASMSENGCSSELMRSGYPSAVEGYRRAGAGYENGMEISHDAPERDGGGRRCIRIATAGDIHCGRQAACEHLRGAVEDVASRVDCFLLAGDLTTHGEPEQGAILAEAFTEVEVPVFTVLGNHDWHVNRRDELVAVLEEGGIQVLEGGEHRILDVCGGEIGGVGAKGFVGGFPGSHLPVFGEPLLREVYAESVRDA